MSDLDGLLPKPQIGADTWRPGSTSMGCTPRDARKKYQGHVAAEHSLPRPRGSQPPERP